MQTKDQSELPDDDKIKALSGEEIKPFQSITTAGELPDESRETKWEFNEIAKGVYQGKPKQSSRQPKPSLSDVVKENKVIMKWILAKDLTPTTKRTFPAKWVGTGEYFVVEHSAKYGWVLDDTHLDKVLVLDESTIEDNDGYWRKRCEDKLIKWVEILGATKQWVSTLEPKYRIGETIYNQLLTVLENVVEDFKHIKTNNHE